MELYVPFYGKLIFSSASTVESFSLKVLAASIPSIDIITVVERGSYSERDASNIVRQIISGLKYLHSLGIAHRGKVTMFLSKT